MLKGQRIGTVCLVSDLGELGSRLKHFSAILLAILFGAALLVYVTFEYGSMFYQQRQHLFLHLL